MHQRLAHEGQKCARCAEIFLGNRSGLRPGRTSSPEKTQLSRTKTEVDSTEPHTQINLMFQNSSRARTRKDCVKTPGGWKVRIKVMVTDTKVM